MAEDNNGWTIAVAKFALHLPASAYSNHPNRPSALTPLLNRLQKLKTLLFIEKFKLLAQGTGKRAC